MLDMSPRMPDKAPWWSSELARAARIARLVAAAAGRIATVGWRWRVPGAAGAVVLAVIWFLLIPAVLGPVVTGYPVLRGEFIQSVVASGHVEAPYRVNIGAQITGIVVEIPVEEGQSVRAGDVLIRLDDAEAKAAVIQADGALAQAEAKLRQIKEVTLPAAQEALTQAQATRLNAEQAFARASQLAQGGYGTRVALDDAKKALDIARAQDRSAQLQVYTNSPGGSDFVMAETQEAQARAALQSAKTRLGYTEVRAPRDGVLIARSVERGYVVQPANVLMVLSPSGETELVVQIDERNLGAVALGQKAMASADAFAKDTFPAEVVYINPGIDLQRATAEVKLKVVDPPAYLRQDMTVSVDIEVGRHPNAIVVSAAAVHDASGNTPWVQKATGGRVRRQAVKVGVVSAGKAEILAGLDQGDIVLAATSTMREGQRVRARATAP